MEKVIVLASNNAHKLQEFQSFFKQFNIKIIPMNDIVKDIDIKEDGNTFKENSAIKAFSLQKHTNLPILSDDSGIIINFLGNNLPGIYSHRMALENGGQDNFNNILIEKASHNSDNSAHFECCLCFILNNKDYYCYGRADGYIITEKLGNNGFGYDPIFYSIEAGKTFAQLSEEEKNKVSHRAKALQNLVILLKELNFI